MTLTDPEPQLSNRRELLGVLAGFLTFILTAPFPRRNSMEIGAVPEEEGFTFFAGYWVIREGLRIAVCEGFCPHWGCRIHPTAHGFRCPCHGSLFARDGKRLEGPSPRSLLWFSPFTRKGRLFIELTPHTQPIWHTLETRH